MAAMAPAGDKRARIVVVDGSRLVRRLIRDILDKELDDPEIIACETGEEALGAVADQHTDLVTTALRLPDMDGMALSSKLREQASQHYFPVIVVSGDVTERLHREGRIAEVTDYFDKSHGFEALGAFIRGYVNPDESVTGRVLFVEDSRVVTLAAERMLTRQGLEVEHVKSVEEALDHLGDADRAGRATDVVLSDVYLKGGMTGHDLLRKLRQEWQVDRLALPVLVITGDTDPKHHAELLRLGANDLVEKPIEESLLVTKIRFQLQLRHQALAHRERGARDA